MAGHYLKDLDLVLNPSGGGLAMGSATHIFSLFPFLIPDNFLLMSIPLQSRIKEMTEVCRL